MGGVPGTPFVMPGLPVGRAVLAAWLAVPAPGPAPRPRPCPPSGVVACCAEMAIHEVETIATAKARGNRAFNFLPLAMSYSFLRCKRCGRTDHFDRRAR